MMDAIVMYRDLPGGPTNVRLGEELSRYCLCTQCGMLSMSVYQDRQGHVFCSACVDERNYKQHKHDIFCKYEQRNVSLDEMVQAYDVITVIRDQFTFCPNNNCEERVPLEALSDHYSQCTPEVHCADCRKKVPSSEWKEHWKNHLISGREEPTPMETNQEKWRMERSSKNHPAGGETTSQLLLCEHCRRPVKEANMPRHLEVCFKAPLACVYCDRRLPKQDMGAHLSECNQNPDSTTVTTCAALRASRPEPQRANKAYGSCSQETTIPELPTLALSDEDMKTWHSAFEEHLSSLGISDDKKYNVLLSTLPPDIITEVGKSETHPPPGREYEWLLEVLFKLSESARRKCSARGIMPDALKNALRKWKEGLGSFFPRTVDGLPEQPKNQSNFYSQTPCEVVTTVCGPGSLPFENAYTLL